MKQYIVKHQEGGYISMDAWKNKLGGRTMQQDATKKVVDHPGVGILRNYLTGQAVTQQDAEDKVAGIPMIGKQPAQPTVVATPTKSIREKMMSGINWVNRDGQSEVAKAVTAPVSSVLNLMRPDKYFSGITNDNDVLRGVGNMAMDVAQAAPLVGGVGKLASMASRVGGPSMDGLAALNLSEGGVKPTNFSNVTDPAGGYTFDKDALIAKLKAKPLFDINAGLEVDPDIEQMYKSYSPNNIIQPQDWHKGKFIEQMQATHNVDANTLSEYYDKWSSEHPNLNSKDIGFMAKRHFNNSLLPDFEYGQPTKFGSITDPINEDFIKANNIATEYTPEEKLITSQYTRGYDSYLNGRHYSLGDKPILQPAIKGTTHDLEQLIQKNKLQQPTTVYRGVNQYTIPEVKNIDGTVRQNVKMDDLREGDIYAPNSFTSTSIKPLANVFGDISMEIQLPGGGKQSVLYPNAMPRSEYPNEYEALLPKNLQYKVEGTNPYKMSVMNPYSIVGLLGGAGLLGTQFNSNK